MYFGRVYPIFWNCHVRNVVAIQVVVEVQDPEKGHEGDVETTNQCLLFRLPLRIAPNNFWVDRQGLIAIDVVFRLALQ